MASNDDPWITIGEYMYYNLVDPTFIDDYGTCSVAALGDEATYDIFEPIVYKNGYAYKVTDMGGCYKNHKNLTEVNVPLVSASNPVTYYVQNATSAFEGCTSLIDAGFFELFTYLSGNSLGNMRRCFANCTSLEYIPTFTPTHATSLYDSCFMGCTSLVDASSMFRDVSYAGTEHVTDLYGCFNGCTSLTTPPDYIPASVHRLNQCFYGCTSLTTPPDISNLAPVGNTYIELSYCFYGCTSLTTTITSYPAAVATMDHTYAYCTSLTTVPVNGLPYAHGDGMRLASLTSCFEGCTALEHCYAKIGHTVTTAYACFRGCTSLIDVVDLGATVTYYESGRMVIETPSLEYISYIFKNCTNLNCEIRSDATIPTQNVEQAFTGTTKQIAIYSGEDYTQPSDMDSWYASWNAAANTSSLGNVKVLYEVKNLPPNIEYQIVRRVGSNGSTVADADGTWVYLKLYTTVYFNAVRADENVPRIPEITVDSVVVQAGGGDTTPLGSATYEFWYDTQTHNAVTIGFTPYDMYNGVTGHTDPTPIYVTLPSGFVVLEVYPGGHGIGLGMGAIVNQLTVGYNTWIYGQVNAGDSLTNTRSYSSIVGGSGHTISNQADYAGIFGGRENTVYAPRAAILGGNGNTIGNTTQGSNPAMHAAIVGGSGNSIVSSTTSSGAQSTAIVGGATNSISGTGNYAGIFGGYGNTLSGGFADSVIVSGQGNTISNTYSGILSGQQNTISRSQSAILGGMHNTVTGRTTILGRRSAILGGRYLTSYADNQVVMGQYNATSETAAIVVGNGTSSTALSNGWELDPDGTQRVQSTPDLPVLHYSEFPTTLIENDTLPVRPCLLITDDGGLYFCYEDSGSAMNPQ